eukprot:TRINITY_DN42055_c0_g1_i1.p1 TRINITY_DN42055_c0_g1~~TRINITY_DN42055_c0_g1_i1.p1  ORF type:complete len:222 (-),score=37.58 TRINITY_DN42055_c0_g1_i1:254-919(-)
MALSNFCLTGCALSASPLAVSSLPSDAGEFLLSSTLYRTNCSCNATSTSKVVRLAALTTTVAAAALCGFGRTRRSFHSQRPPLGSAEASPNRGLVACAAKSSREKKPSCVVFDLDGCLWHPDMYMLWGKGGAPFNLQTDGTLRDRAGNCVAMHSGVPGVMTELSDDDSWKGVLVAVASCCDEPSWAWECLSKFTFLTSKGGKKKSCSLKEIMSVCEFHGSG